MFCSEESDNWLNKLVTSYFLEVKWVYTRIFQSVIIQEFSSVINQCKISLNNINETIMYHMASLVSDQDLNNLKERKIKGDKFVSNLFKARIDYKLLGKSAPKGGVVFEEMNELISQQSQE